MTITVVMILLFKLNFKGVVKRNSYFIYKLIPIYKTGSESNEFN